MNTKKDHELIDKVCIIDGVVLRVDIADEGIEYKGAWQ